MSIDLPSNGHVSDPYAAAAAEARMAVQGEVTNLRVMLTDERRLRDRLDRLIDESKTRERRLAKAIAALEDEPPATKKPAAATATKSVGAATIDRVAIALAGFDEPVMAKDIAERTGLSVGAARAALQALRDDERARVARVEPGRGQGKTYYAAMPEQEPASAT